MKRYISLLKENDSVEKQLKQYLDKVQDTSDTDFKKNYPTTWERGGQTKFTYKVTPKWFKVLRITDNGKGQSSVFAFVDKTNGDIYKPAGFNSPAKGIRGNINDEKVPITSEGLYRR